jgi:hypothetical protein
MTDHQYGDCQFEIYFDSVKGPTPRWGSALRWEDLTWPRYLTTLPILLKDIRHSDEVRRAKDYGVEAIYSALNSLPDVADGTAVLLDSGVRSGSEAAKTLAAEGYCRAGVHLLEPT